MEGLVLRQGRASSRYASGPSPASFSGPVRKWKKQWVLSQPNKAPPLLLFRWTPLTAADSAVEPRKRRFYYAPTVTIIRSKRGTLEEESHEAGTSRKNYHANNGGVNMTSDPDGMTERNNSNGDFCTEEIPESEDQQNI